MEEVLRVSILTRCYEIPANTLSEPSLSRLKGLVDANNNINPRDLLQAFLELSEEMQTLQNTLLEASQKIQNFKS